ncbi:MAG TPA: MerR family transcriptional regulator [Candidatus Paceibacterota bacterium]
MKDSEKLLTIEQVSDISGVRISRLSSYVRSGILQYEEQEKEGVRRYYDKEKTLKRLKEIKEVEKEGFTKKEMMDLFCGIHINWDSEREQYR